MKYFFLVFLTLTIFMGYSQEYAPGYITLIPGDTIPGFIKLNTEAENYKICLFKKDSAGATATYTPDNLMAYGIDNNRCYQARELVINNVAKRVFAEVLFDGMIDLFKYKRSFFIRKKDSTNFPLIKTGDPRSQDPLKRFSYNQLLQILTVDCPSLTYELKSLKFTEQSFVRYIEQYHQCKNYQYTIYKNNLSWNSFELQPFIGYQLSTLSSSDFNERKDLKPARGNNPLIGLSFQFRFPRTNRNLTLLTDIMFSHASYQSKTKTIGLGTAYTYEYLSLKLNTLKIPIGISLPLHKKSGLQIDGGMGFNFFGGKPKFTYERFFNGVVYTEYRVEKIEYFKYSFYFGLRHRLTFPNFQIPVVLRFDHTPQFTFRKSSLTSVYLTIGLKRSSK